MTDRVPQTKNELKRHLLEQLEFLERSADLYDQGHENEAKRMATVLRTLLHDTKNIKSLLGLLDKKGIQFVDTAMDDISNVITTHCALVHQLLLSGKPKYVALLDDIPSKMKDFDSWWAGVIFIDEEGNKISRKDIILTMANQDGGVHVDPGIDKDYSRLSKGQSLGHMYSNNGSNWLHMHGAELASVRQIAHELLKTLKTGYVKKPNLPDGIAIRSGIQIEFEKEQNERG